MVQMAKRKKNVSTEKKKYKSVLSARACNTNSSVQLWHFSLPHYVSLSSVRALIHWNLLKEEQPKSHWQRRRHRLCFQPNTFRIYREPNKRSTILLVCHDKETKRENLNVARSEDYYYYMYVWFFFLVVGLSASSSRNPPKMKADVVCRLQATGTHGAARRAHYLSIVFDFVLCLRIMPHCASTQPFGSLPPKQ